MTEVKTMEERGISPSGIAFRTLLKNPLAVVCFIIIVIYSIAALMAHFQLIAKDYRKVVFEDRYQPPSKEHILGTDYMGRDVFQRVIHGSKISMKVGLITSVIAIPIGIFFGAIAGYFGGIVDELVIWLYSTMASIPGLLFVLSISFVLRGVISPLVSVYLAIGFTSWVGLCRILRGEFMKHKEREYVLAARSLGFGSWRVIFRHIFPNVFHIVIIQFSLRFVYSILAEVILSYIGVGVEKEPSWGIMISDAKLELARGYWWQFAGATGAMFLIVLSLNLFGDALRDAVDPRLRSL